MNRRQTVHAGPPHIAAQVAAAWASLDAPRAGTVILRMRCRPRIGHSWALCARCRSSATLWDRPRKYWAARQRSMAEIAEQVNVAIIRARDVLFGNAPTATLEGVGRLAPVDYRVDGMDIQVQVLQWPLQHTRRRLRPLRQVPRICERGQYLSYSQRPVPAVPSAKPDREHRWTLRQERKRNQRQTRLAGTADRQVGGRSDQSGRDHVPRGAAGTYSRHDQRP